MLPRTNLVEPLVRTAQWLADQAPAAAAAAVQTRQINRLPPRHNHDVPYSVAGARRQLPTHLSTCPPIYPPVHPPAQG
jgi:hypothetical protein